MAGHLMSDFRRCPSSQGIENLGEGGARAQDEVTAPAFGITGGKGVCSQPVIQQTPTRPAQASRALICKQGGDQI